MILVSNLILVSNSKFVKANPVPMPDYDMEFGPQFNNSANLKLFSAYVSIDCYEMKAIGKGNYIISNLGNVSASSIIEFYATMRPTTILNISINSTQINASFPIYMETDNNIPTPNRIYYRLDPSTNERIIISGGIPINIGINKSIDLEISWGFDSYRYYKFDYNENLIILKEVQRHLYQLTYKINGAYYWNGNTIENETVRFKFHSDKFYIQNKVDLDITTYDDEKVGYSRYHTGESKSLILEYDSDGVPYIEYQIDNFSYSYGLEIFEVYEEKQIDYFEMTLFLIVLILMCVLYFKLCKIHKDFSFSIPIFFQLIGIWFFGLNFDSDFIETTSLFKPVIIFFYLIPPLMEYKIIRKKINRYKQFLIENNKVFEKNQKKFYILLCILSSSFILYFILMILLNNFYYTYLLDDMSYLNAGIFYILSLIALLVYIDATINKEDRKELEIYIKELNEIQIRMY
jgi:hypothetical protein